MIRNTPGKLLIVLLPLLACAQSPDIRGIPRFHKVSEHVYRGALPTAEGLRALSQSGVLTVLDLRSGEETLGSEGAAVTALGMHYLRVPMRGFSPPTQAQIEQGLRILEDPQNWPVFVHCRYGVDRTGTLIACYRIRAESWPNVMAKKEAEQMGMHRLERGMKQFILQFPPR